MKRILLFLFLGLNLQVASCQSVTVPTSYEIPQARLFLKTPNTQWHLTTHTETMPISYIFKRDPIKDSADREIVPAIMLFVTDASEFKQDATLFTITKRKKFMEKGVRIDSTLIQSNKEYPLSYKNGYFMKASYRSNGLDHILYMIHILTKEDKGVELYLDMTTELEKTYGTEFWVTIRSLREL